LRRIAVVAAVLLAIAPGAKADGGRLRLKETAGPFTVAVFTAPDPLTAGPAEVSVLVQDALTSDVVLDADVEIRLRALEGIETVHYAAAPGPNRLFRQAAVKLPFPGRWHLEVSVRRNAQAAIVSTLLTVAPPASPWRTAWPLLAAPVVLVALFLAGARRRRSSNPSP
jgi:hypothetical protein